MLGPMRYNKEIQKLADECAQEEDYLCASYMGRYKDSFMFEPMYEDNFPRCTGLPCIIFVKDGVASFWRELGLSDVYKNMRNIGSAGRRIAKRYRQMLKEDACESEEQREYISSVLDYLDSPLTSKSELYQFIEIAERLGKKLEFFTVEGLSNRMYTPNGEYIEQFIRVV